MSTRVTQSMLSQNLMYNLQISNKAMEKYQQQASSGKKINRPSDDPVTAVRSMYYRSSLNEIDQYKQNADDGYSWLTSTDDALDEVTSVLQRVRELTVQGQNGTNSPSDQTAIAEEIKQLRDHLGEVANTQVAGRYIFAGTDVKNAPYDTAANQFTNTNQGKLEVQVGQNSRVQMNVNGSTVFNNDGNGGIFKVLTDIYNDFSSGEENTTDHLAELDGQLDNILKERADLGARTNRMELSISRLEDLETSTTSLLSNEEDVDIAQVIMDLKTQENVQKAALSVGAQIIQPTLVDFLN